MHSACIIFLTRYWILLKEAVALLRFFSRVLWVRPLLLIKASIQELSKLSIFSEQCKKILIETEENQIFLEERGQLISKSFVLKPQVTSIKP